MRIKLIGVLGLFFVTLAAAGAQPAVYQNNKTAVLYLGTAPVIGDGDVAGWAGLAGSSPEIFVYGAPKGDHDPSAVFVLRSDNKRLFIYAEVTDKNANENPLPAPLAWRNDSVEIFVGTDVSGHTHFAPGDSQIRLVPRSRSDVHAIGVSVNDLIVDGKKDVEGAVVYTEKGYRIVAAIPLRLLHIKGFKAGQPFRAEFQINDATTGERDNLVHWKSKGDDPYYDASVWGDGVVEALPEAK